MAVAVPSRGGDRVIARNGSCGRAMPHCAGMTAAIENVHLVVGAAARRGVPPGKLLAAVGLDPQSLMASDGRVPAEPVLRLWNTAAELCGDPDFGLSLVEHLHPSYLGGLGLAIHASATFGEALRRLARFFALVNQRAALELIDDGPLVRVRFVVGGELDNEVLRHPTLAPSLQFLRAAVAASGRQPMKLEAE